MELMEEEFVMNNANTERKIEIENYIKENNVTAIRNLLDSGMAPMEEIENNEVHML